MDYVPVKNPKIEYETAENGRVTVSDIKMDELGSFVWLAIDDQKDVHQLSKELDEKFPKMEKSLARLIKFLEILRDNHLIYWKGEKQR